ncbi:MAG: glycoside hydrolase family 16 protein [Novosphingobium sp.]|uniref:glycoside hydrolase family 16 protein n=1 Tax=Novosphingobium sp. TaxID=1874826 RepID=UPI0032B79368
MSCLLRRPLRSALPLLVPLAAALAAAGGAAPPKPAPKTTPKAAAVPLPVPAPGAHHAPPGYTLVWADEFYREGRPDPLRWTAETHRNKDGWHNAEAQYYSAGDPANAREERGVLAIEARAGAPGTAAARPADWGKQLYTSARLTSGPKGTWTYGWFEVRAKVACGRGIWPAIWMLPADPARKWPDDGEIDIMEHVGHNPGVVHHSVHTKAFNHAIKTEKTAVFPLADACAAMHRYQLHWTADRITMGVDDTVRFTFARAGTDRARWPFDKPMRLLLNVAVGGTWGGEKGIDPAAFPARMEVDYVRVYQRRK